MFPWIQVCAFASSKLQLLDRPFHTLLAVDHTLVLDSTFNLMKLLLISEEHVKAI